MERIRIEADQKVVEAEGKAKAAAAEIERAAAEATAKAEQAEREAHAITEQAEREVLEVVAEPIIIPPMPAPAKVGGVSKAIPKYRPVFGNVRDLIAAAATNPDAYAQYLTFNDKAIGAAVRAQGDKFRCPGVEVVEETGMTIRASK